MAELTAEQLHERALVASSTWRPPGKATDAGLLALCGRLESLAGAATPGPWHRGSFRQGDKAAREVVSYGQFAQTRMYTLVCEADVADMEGCYGFVGVEQTGKNLDFVAESREAVPALVAEVRRLLAERDILRAELAGVYQSMELLPEAADAKD